MQTAEIELKFQIDDLERLQSRLPGLGFQLDTPRTFEQNTLYDTGGRDLRASKQILRVRRYGDIWTVTHKRQPSLSTLEDQSRYKVRVETESIVEDGDALAVIFEQLGYGAMFRYEKFRTEWSQPASLYGEASLDPGLCGPDLPPPPSKGHLVIDETPIGEFAELEGTPEWIDRTLALLQVDLSACTTESYGRLFLAWKQRTGSPAENLTFDEIPALAMQLQDTLR